jgi:anti-sigma regulatory factor (Ser/Thr protein kinase)
MNLIDSHKDCQLLHEGQIESQSSILLLRARVQSVAHRLGFSENVRQNMALVASELGSNILKFAAGHGVVQVWQQPGPTLDIFALDYGVGIANIERAVTDGYSSANTLGKGLGSVMRLSDAAMIYSRTATHSPIRKWTGTAVLARFRQNEKADLWAAPTQVGLFSRSLSDERYNGDIIYLQRSSQSVRWLHLDGLGHGRTAHDTTAQMGNELFAEGEPMQVLLGADRHLAGSRGAVGIAAEVRFLENKYILAGIGDLHAHISHGGSDETDVLFFAPGILGREHKQATEHHHWFEHHGLVITASDGLRRNWDGHSFPGLLAQHPQLIAYVLGNIMGRMSDDQSICIVSLPRQGS